MGLAWLGCGAEAAPAALRHPRSLLGKLAACARRPQFRRHLPVLLHVAVLNSDSPDSIVRREAGRVLVYLLYSLSAKHLEAQAGGGGSPEYARVAGVIARLQAMHGAPLWRRERPSLDQPLVPSSLSVASFVQTGGGGSPLHRAPGCPPSRWR